MRLNKNVFNLDWKKLRDCELRKAAGCAFGTVWVVWRVMGWGLQPGHQWLGPWCDFYIYIGLHAPTV